MSKNFKKRLSSMKDNWNDSKNAYEYTFGDSKIDTGTYIAKLQKAELTETKSSKKLVVKRTHIIIKGRFKGVPVFDMIHLESNDDSFKYLRKWFNDMGYESPTDPGEIEELIETISSEGAEVEIYVKRSGDFTNVEVLKLLDDDDDNNDDSNNELTNDNEDPKEEEEEGEEEEGEGEEEGEEEEEEEEEEDELTGQLRAFCEANLMDEGYDSEWDLDKMVEEVSEFKFPEGELTKEEIKMFKDLDMQFCIHTKPKPKAKAKAKAKAKPKTKVKKGKK